MRIAASRAGQVSLLGAVLVAACLWASLLACREPHPADGAGGQSGDEGRRPRFEGAGGGAAESRSAQ